MVKRMLTAALCGLLYCGTLRSDPGCTELQLTADASATTVDLYDTVTVTVYLGCVGDPLYGFQAFLKVDPIIGGNTPGAFAIALSDFEYNPDVFGLPLVYPSQDEDGNITLAAGVDFFHSQPPTETGGAVCTLTFTAINTGTATLRFVDHEPPTSVSDGGFDYIKPATVDSQTITVQ